MVWGSGWRGQLGTKENGPSTWEASPPGQRILHYSRGKVVCGPSHALFTLAQDEGGSGRREDHGTPSSSDKHDELDGPGWPRKAWVWGRNCSGQLGLGDTVDRHRPTPLPLLFGTLRHQAWVEDAIDIASVGIGSYHTVIAVSDISKRRQSSVLVCGRGRRGQTGLGSVEDVTYPTEIPELRDQFVSTVACGDDFTVVSSNERVLSFGNGTKTGQGTSSVSDHLRAAPVRGIPAPIHKIVCGWGHTLALTDKGIFTWGANMHGQCGLGHSEFVPTAEHVKALSGMDIVDIAAGSAHSIALTRSGQVFVWGSYADGRLGLNNEESSRRLGDVREPRLLDQATSFGGSVVLKIASGADHSAALTEDGVLWLWGFGQHGALGSHSNEEFGADSNLWQPRRLNLDRRVKAVSCGMDMTIVRV